MILEIYANSKAVIVDHYGRFHDQQSAEEYAASGNWQEICQNDRPGHCNDEVAIYVRHAGFSAKQGIRFVVGSAPFWRGASAGVYTGIGGVGISILGYVPALPPINRRHYKNSAQKSRVFCLPLSQSLAGYKDKKKDKNSHKRQVWH